MVVSLLNDPIFFRKKWEKKLRKKLLIAGECQTFSEKKNPHLPTQYFFYYFKISFELFHVNGHVIDD